MKMNPHGTGIPITSIILKRIIRRHCFYSPKPLSILPGVRASFFRTRPKLLRGIRCCSHTFSQKSAFILTCTAQPPCLSVTPSQGQTFRPNSPKRELSPNLTETLQLPSSLMSQAFSAFLPPLTTMTQQRKKKYLCNPSRSSLSSRLASAHTPPHGRGSRYLARKEGALTTEATLVPCAAPPFPVLPSRPPTPPSPRRPRGNCFALGNKHTPLLPSRNHKAGGGVHSSSQQPPQNRQTPE